MLGTYSGGSIKTLLHLPDLSCCLERISAASWRIFLGAGGGWEGPLGREGSCSCPPSSFVDWSKHRCEPGLFSECVSQQAQTEVSGHVCRCVSQAFFLMSECAKASQYVWCGVVCCFFF